MASGASHSAEKALPYATSSSSSNITYDASSPDYQQASPSSPPPLPFIPTLAVTSPDNYGRIDPENESNLALLASVSDDGLRKNARLRTMLAGDGDGLGHRASSSSSASVYYEAESDIPSTSPSDRSRLLEIPPEIIDMILSYLSPYDLLAVSATCHALRKYGLSDTHWQTLVQDNVPGVNLKTPSPCATFSDLYAAHDRFWFLPKYKLWFCDRDLTGKLIIVRYDPRRGCIEGYQLLAGRNKTTFQHWPADSQVIIHGFEPEVKLHLDKPVLQFRVRDGHNDRHAAQPGANRFSTEIPMALDDRLQAMYSNFLLARPLDPEVAEEKLATEYPYDNVWPPPAIPARHHVSGMRTGQDVFNLLPQDRPQRRSQVSDQAFRIRQWMEMAGSVAAPGVVLGQAGGIAAMVSVIAGVQPMNAMPTASIPGIHIGEEVITYATLDPSVYTPTPLKPWRGIWVGDYSGHGCEFLLINQPDDLPATDGELGLFREEGETDEEWEKRITEARIYRGRLEAIKLTGDPNVPRGEYTFVADDLGPGGFVGVATDEPFSGARVVQSKGHVAATGFLRDKFIESQLLLISKNRLAQYWVGFGHISFFERVDIDSFLTL